MLHRIVNDRVFAKQMGQMQITEFPEDSLTEDEKCAIFFSISHTVNQTKV